MREALSRELADPDASAQLFRAAYVPESVLPARVQRVYRFGPPPELSRPDGTPPFWWLYAAHAAETAIWEAQFCKNDVTRAGTFYFDTFAVQHGVVAELKFPRIGVRLPSLSLEVFRPKWSRDADSGLAVFESDRVIALDRKAGSAGICAGMRRGGVLTLAPDTAMQDRDLEREDHAIRALAA